MNSRQVRLLLEVEFNFYRLGETEVRFKAILKALGYKPEPRLALLDDAALKRLNRKLRSYLRSTSSL